MRKILPSDDSQSGRILRRLMETPNEWVPMVDLAQKGSGKDRGWCICHSRCSDLRASDYLIEHRNEMVDGQIHSFYRFLPHQISLFERGAA